MTAVAAPKAAFWTIERFRDFIETRPEEERWELIDDVALMQAPPLVTHQAIASNLEHLLNEALERFDPSRIAFQRLGLDLTPEVDTYQPEPDVVVIDAPARAGAAATSGGSTSSPRSSRRATRGAFPKGDRTRIGAKLDIYKTHEHCLSVLAIEQSRVSVRIDRRTAGGWVSSTLEDPDDRLAAFACATRRP